MFQIFNNLGIADHAWQDKDAAIAVRADNLGDGFCPALLNGWLAYIKKAYPARTVASNTATGQGESVVDDSEIAGAGPA